MALTDTKVKNLKPSNKCTPTRPDKYSDGDNLRLWVRHTGTKVWVSDYMYQGKRQSLTIGKYPVMGLADARKRNIEIKSLLADGIDPKAQKQKYTAARNGISQFSHFADLWYAHHKEYVTTKTYKRNLSQYERDIAPIIGHMDIADISAPDILNIGKRIEQRGASDMAKRAIRQVSQIFRMAMREGKIKYDPTVGLTEALKPHKVKHFARIPFDQLPNLLRDIEQYGGDEVVKLGFYLFCYTFVRTNELRFMQWSEIDYAAKLWRIPAERMKMQRPHLVPLSPQALTILDRIKSMNLSDEYVFYNTDTYKPYSENAFTTALWRMGYKGRMTGHGFRGLASTKLHELQYEHKAIELQLAHDTDNAVSRAYNGAELLDYRIKMMNEWAVVIDKARAA